MKKIVFSFISILFVAAIVLVAILVPKKSGDTNAENNSGDVSAEEVAYSFSVPTKLDLKSSGALVPIMDLIYGYNNNIVYEVLSSDASVVSIFNGAHLKAESKGTATVTISSFSGEIKTCEKSLAVNVFGEEMQIVANLFKGEKVVTDVMCGEKVDKTLDTYILKIETLPQIDCKSIVVKFSDNARVKVMGEVKIVSLNKFLLELQFLDAGIEKAFQIYVEGDETYGNSFQKVKSNVIDLTLKNYAKSLKFDVKENLEVVNGEYILNLIDEKFKNEAISAGAFFEAEFNIDEFAKILNKSSESCCIVGNKIVANKEGLFCFKLEANDGSFVSREIKFRVRRVAATNLSLNCGDIISATVGDVFCIVATSFSPVYSCDKNLTFYSGKNIVDSLGNIDCKSGLKDVISVFLNGNMFKNVSVNIVAKDVVDGAPYIFSAPATHADNVFYDETNLVVKVVLRGDDPFSFAFRFKSADAKLSIFLPAGQTVVGEDIVCEMGTVLLRAKSRGEIKIRIENANNIKEFAVITIIVE